MIGSNVVVEGGKIVSKPLAVGGETKMLWRKKLNTL